MEPQAVFEIFSQINKVPRPSKHEEKISKWLCDFAAAHNIDCVTDEAMNVIMRVPATKIMKESSSRRIWTWCARKTATFSMIS